MHHDVRLGADRAAAAFPEAISGKRYRPPITEGPETFGELVEFAVRRRNEPTSGPTPSLPEPTAPRAPRVPISAVDFGSEPGGEVPEQPAAPQIGGPSILPPPPTEGQLGTPPTPPLIATSGRLLGTRAEYQLDPESAKGSSYRGVAVRYWNVYSDGTKVMLEGWSRWTGTVDASLAKTDLEGGNVVGLVFGSPPPVNG